MKPAKFTVDDKTVNLMRNCLLVAGHEMGEDGDHWPVINSTIHSLAKDWDRLKNERAAHEEMKKHVYAELTLMDKAVDECKPEEKAGAAAVVAELRDIYDAYFAPTDGIMMPLVDGDKPAYVRRAEKIIMSLEE